MIAQAAPNTLMNTAEVARYLGLSRRTLEKWRCEKTAGLPFIKLPRGVRYRRGDVEAFLSERTQDGGGQL